MRKPGRQGGIRRLVESFVFGVSVIACYTGLVTAYSDSAAGAGLNVTCLVLSLLLLVCVVACVYQLVWGIADVVTSTRRRFDTDNREG